MKDKQDNVRTQCGDGKLPNKYWVMGSAYFLYQESGNSYEGTDAALSGDRAEYYGVFKTFAEAYNKAAEVIAENFGEEPVFNGINSVTIEDRLSGEVFSAQFYAHRTKPNIMGGAGWKFTNEEHRDTNYTEKEMAKRGVEFK